MSVKSSVRNFTHNQEDCAINEVINKNFAMLEDILKQEIDEMEKLWPYKLDLNDNALDNLEKLLDSFIVPSNQSKNYLHASNFLKKYS
jgi:hypothetical protein